MIGEVRSLHALLPVQFHLVDGSRLTIEFVVDTGFTGLLTLPQSAIDAMALPFEYPTYAQLADGSTVIVAIYKATIVWRGEEVHVRILATGERPLLGTALLANSALTVQFTENGIVTITDL